jgi:hypothetical protein
MITHVDFAHPRLVFYKNVQIGAKKIIVETRHHNQQPSKKRCGLSRCVITIVFGATNLTRKLMKQ